jgi:quercetin dioxygenase-like cupin family protein
METIRLGGLLMAVHLEPNGGRAFSHLGTSIVFKQEPNETGDVFLFEMRMPAGNGVPPHTERNREAFYVLDGVLEVAVDGEPRRLGAGEFLAIEPGTLHSLHNPGPSWVHALTWVAPGRQHVRFFEQLGEPLDDPMNPPQPDGPPDVEELMRVARECGMEFRAG